MAELDLELAVFAGALSLAFVGSPLLDYFLKGGRGSRKSSPAQVQRRTWWLFFLTIWFAATAVASLGVGVDKSAEFDWLPPGLFVAGLFTLIGSIAEVL